jgi:hypothetical protein
MRLKEMNHLAPSHKLRESETARMTLGRNSKALNKAKQQLDPAAVHAPEEVSVLREQMPRRKAKKGHATRGNPRA